jgi:pyrroloquinoline quinone biosynthesis protein B
LAARAGKISPQTQSSVAVSGDNQTWFLINASPDLAQQIESNSALQPRATPPRNSPIAGVLLTNGDIDHALGLLLLRQHETPVVVYADKETREALQWIYLMLNQFCGIRWKATRADFEPLGGGIAFRAIQLQASVAFQLRDESSGATALIAPAVGKITGELISAVRSSHVVLFDGTFWSNDELSPIRPGARDSREMNHLPISDGSLEFLRSSTARRKIYTHINNTNPILMPGSRERMQVEQAGIEIACDGLEIEL